MLSHQIIKRLLKCNEEGKKMEDFRDNLGIFIQHFPTDKRTNIDFHCILNESQECFVDLQLGFQSYVMSGNQLYYW